MWVEVKRDSKVYRQKYEMGKPKTEVEVVKDPFTTKLFPMRPDVNGTTVTFFPDTTIFQTGIFDFEIVKKAIRERAYLVPKLYFHLYDTRKGQEKEVNYYFEGGITAL